MRCATSTVPVYATPMAAGLITARLREHGLDQPSTCTSTARASAGSSGRSRIDPIHVTHSIVDAVGAGDHHAARRRRAHRRLQDRPHADRRPRPRTSRPSPSTARAACCCCCPTRPTSSTPDRPASERSVRRRSGQRSSSGAAGRIFFSTFSSHVHRLQQVIELSEATGRRVAVVGRSLREQHHASPPTSATCARRRRSSPTSPSSPRCRRAQVTVLTSGSQGEPLSALTRIAMDDHGSVQMEPGDAVVLSSRIIPGNERPISNMINHMYRRGAQVFTLAQRRRARLRPRQPGRAGADAQPGAAALLRAGARRVSASGRARAAGALASAWREDAAFLLEDGQVLEIDAAGARRGEPITRRARVRRRQGHRRHQRHRPARPPPSVAGRPAARRAGASISTAASSSPGRTSRRAASFAEDEQARYFEEARDVVLATLAAIAPESRTDSLEVKEEVRKALRRYFSKTLDRRPVVAAVRHGDVSVARAPERREPRAERAREADRASSATSRGLLDEVAAVVSLAAAAFLASASSPTRTSCPT